jgi:hypothetical protein
MTRKIYYIKKNKTMIFYRVINNPVSRALFIFFCVFMVIEAAQVLLEGLMFFLSKTGPLGALFLIVFACTLLAGFRSRKI